MNSLTKFEMTGTVVDK